MIAPTFTCPKCAAREMSKFEYLCHLAVSHDIRVRIGSVTALVLAR